MYTVSFVGAPNTKKKWSGVHGYRPDTQGEAEEKGELLVVMALGSKHGFDFDNLAKLLFDEIQQSYFFSGAYTEPLEQIELAINMMNKRIDKILEREPKLMESGLDMQVGISVVRGDVAYIAVIGEARVVLAREEKLIDIDPHLQDTTGKNFLRNGSFELDPNTDSLILFTDVAEKFVSKSTWQQISTELDLSQIEHIEEAGFCTAIIVAERRVEEVHNRMAQAATDDKNVEAQAKSDIDVPGIMEDREDKDKVKNKEDLPSETVEGKDESTQSQSDSEVQTDKELAEFEQEVLDAESRVDSEDDEASQEEVSTDEQESVVANIRQRSTAALTKGKTMLGDSGGKLEPSFLAARAKTVTIFEQAKERLVGFRSKDRSLETPSKSSEVEVVGRAEVEVDESQQKTYQVIINRFVKAIQNGWRGIVRFVRKNFGGGERNRAMYLQGRSGGRNWKLIAVITVVVGLLLFAVINNAIDNSNQQRLREEATLQLSKIENGDETVKGLAALEAEVISLEVGLGNETERATKITEIEEKISDIDGVAIDEIRENDDLAAAKTELTGKYAQLVDQLRGIQLVEPVLIADINVNFQNVNASDIAFTDGNVYVSDRENDVIYKVAATPNATPVKFASDKLSSPVAIDIDDRGDLIVIDEDPNSSIATVSLTDGSVQKHVGGLNTSNVGIPNNFKAFRVGEQDRLYWLDGRTNEMKWVTRSAIGGYGSAPSVRREDPDFATAVDIDIDGRIFVLSPEKGILRYFASGASNFNLVPDPYTLTGLLGDDALTNTTALELTKDLIYLADPSNNRIVVLSKARNGSDAGFVDMLGQLVYRGSGNVLGGIRDLVFDESANTLYVLDGQKVYRVGGYED